MSLAMSPVDKIARRIAFLGSCDQNTRTIHAPIIDLDAVAGHLNPAGMGNAAEFSRTAGFGQSAVGFDDVEDYHAADKTGQAQYGGAEYAIVQSPETDLVCRKMANLHGGVGAIILTSGLLAITITLQAFSPHSIAVPDNLYGPLMRYVNDINRHAKPKNPKLWQSITHHALEWLQDKFELPQPGIKLSRYPANASAAEVEKILDHSKIDMIYLEAPGSQTFEIPDIKGIASLARTRGIRTVMDNTWGSHVRLQPLKAGIDIAIQATTKYEGGYFDTPSGIVVAQSENDIKQLQWTSRVLGAGAIDPGRCMRLYHRLDSTKERMDQHYESALQLMGWFKEQDFVADILCPALPTSPDHDRFQEYFGKGNGLFTVVLKEEITPKQANDFMNAMLLFRVYESWGGHVSGLLPVTPQRKLSSTPQGQMIRFHAGLENPADLLRDLRQARGALSL